MSLLESLKTADLLPSPLIPSTFTPKFHLNISYPSISPANGGFVRVSQVAGTPKISISPTSSSSPESESETYTLMLIDPDAPTPSDPKFAYWRHWIVSSIRPTSSTSPSPSTCITDSGITLTPYLAPGPKDESGPHRYLFLLFREPAGLKLGKGDVGGEEFVQRRGFGAAEWVGKWGLEVVGVQWMKGVGDGWVGEGGKSEL